MFVALVLCACARQLDVPPSPEDYGALRFSDPAAFDALVARTAAARSDDGWGQPVATQPDRCTSEIIDQSRRGPWIELAADAADYASWIEDVAALRERLSHVSVIEAAYLDGRDADPRHAPDPETWDVARYAVTRRTTDDPRVRELLGRAIRDQVWRVVTFGDLSEPFREGLSETAQKHWPAIVTTRLAEVDCSNTAWLREQIAAHGWFDISRYGAQSDEAAWLIVQHADRTPAFQGEILPLLEARAAAGESDAQHVAYLWDRVAVKEGRPQRYGTQMDCENGETAPIGGIEDPEHVEQRRAAIGMMTYAFYLQMMRQMNDCSR